MTCFSSAKVNRALLLITLCFLGISCQSSKKSGQIQSDPTAVEPATSSVAETSMPISQESPQEASEVPAFSVETEDPNILEEVREEISEPTSEEPEISPQTLLELALEAIQGAQDDWKTGKMEEALSQLDNAFETILQIEESDQDPLILQEKEDLRFLISKRIVEIYASQRTAVGDLKKSIPLVSNAEVEREIRSFQGRERKFFLDSYKRSGRFRPMILEELRKAGLPEQLSWLPLIESGFKPNALSRARALGLWQFIPSTGYRYGLERNRWVDERMDPHKSTLGAIAYLEDLHSLFGDWMTALAGYNCGEGRVLRVINRQRLNYLDNFWDLYSQLPRETARYVPRFMATLAILKDPAKYGFELPELEKPQDYSVVNVSRSVRLSDLDAMLKLPKDTMKNLNPELRYKTTPDISYPLRVPIARDQELKNGIAALPAARAPRSMDGTHTVRRGETLSTIANRYGSSVRSLMTANRLRNSNRIYPGQKLKVPGRGSSRESSRSVSSVKSGTWVTHRVRRGDSLWRLAKQYRTTVGNIKQWNKLRSNRLSLNQKLRVRAGHSGKVGGKTYRVRQGDTLAKIAQRHGITLRKLLRANSMSKRDTIFPNQKIVIP